MVPHSSALDQCFNEVADSAPMALERCLNQALSRLQQAQGSSTRSDERIELGEALRELAQHQAGWCRRFPQELRAALVAAREPAPQVAQATKRGPVTELSLVDDADIIEAIESARLVQHVSPFVEQRASELDALVSSAMGSATVRPELNPIRPEVFVKALLSLMSGAQVNSARGSLLMKYMAEPLGHELQDLYGRLVVQLKDANVRAAEYGHSARSSSGTARPRGVAGGDASGREAQPASDPAAGGRDAGHPPAAGQQISHALLRDFLRGGSELASQSLPASYYIEVERELVRLKGQAHGQRDDAQPPELPTGYEDLPPVERPQRPVDIQSTLDRQVWGDYAHSTQRALVRSRLRKDARQVAQVLGLELVRKVVNQVAQDPRLLAPVREAIVALEPSLLRLAMVDPRFFSDQSHPGRRLMERVAQRSFRCNDEFSVDFRTFFDRISRCFNELNQAAIADTGPFEAALVQLEASWAAQDSLEEDERDQAVKAMRFAEQRQAEADHIARELSSRADLASVPSVVQDFLFGPWALVLAHARLTDPGHVIDPHGYLAAVSDLLWSVRPEVTLRQPAQLFERVPPLLAKLHAGLGSLGQPPEQNEAFFQALMKLHRPVLKLRRAKSRRDARESGLVPLKALEPMAEPAAAPAAPAPGKAIKGQPWMSPAELDAAGFQETLPTDMAQLWPEAGPSTRAPLATPAPETGSAREKPRTRSQPLTDSEIDSFLRNLRQGHWVDLYAKKRWRRAQLIWAGTNNTLFMFVSQGGQPHSMTRRTCERLTRDRYLRPVRTHEVVAHALTTLDQDDDSA